MYAILPSLPVAGFFLFSWWLMFHTFGYDARSGSMMLAPKVWSDFGAHIPLIRSFSLGDNWPPQYPLFPGQPIRYHFLFYFLVAMLEKAGVRIDYALNIPSIIGFTLLLSGIFFLARRAFQDTLTATLSVLFFLFNGSLSFVRFMANNPGFTLKDIVNVHEFPSFAPWGEGDVTAFWNLNIYTNQRHLAASFAAVLFFALTILVLNRVKRNHQYLAGAVWGLTIGIFPFFHQPTLIVFALMIGLYFVIFPKLRRFLFAAGVVSGVLVILQLPLILGHGPSEIAFYPGYLIHDQLSAGRFLTYWFNNLGLHVVLIPVGFFLAHREARKLFIPFAAVFVVGNLFKFSVEIAANHKFFNIFLIVGAMFSAYALTLFLRQSLRIKPVVLRPPLLLVAALLTAALTFSGVIDFFAVANDRKGPLADIPANPTAGWILENTPPDSIFLTSTLFNNPASIAGRKIFLGWPYFAWSAGYDTGTRMFEDVKAMYDPADIGSLCMEINKNRISYVTFERNPMGDVPVVESLYARSFPAVYENRDLGYRIYEVKTTCARL